MEKANLIFTPSHQQQQYLEEIFDSIVSKITIPYQFYLFTDKVNPEFQSKYDIVIKVVNDADLIKLKNGYFKEKRGDIPAFSAYAQFLIPRYFQEIKDYVYLEVDQIVQGDLAILWKDCLKIKKPLAAVQFYGEDLRPSTVKSFNKIHPNKMCFNTGVLYVNSKFWLQNNFEELCFNELELQKEMNGKRLDFYAQGAINNALQKHIHQLPMKYNFPCLGSVRGLNRRKLKSAIILHWTGPLKPWNLNGLYKELYYRDMTYFNINDYLSFNFLILKLKFIIKRFFRINNEN